MQNKISTLFLSLTLLLSSCVDSVRPQAIVKQELISCNIPDQYLTGLPMPRRTTDWRTKTDADVIEYITDHKTVIERLNEQLEKAKMVQDNCKSKIQEINNKK